MPSQISGKWFSAELWLKGAAAAAISGAANGIVTGFAAIGIDPRHFNLSAGIHDTLKIGGVSALLSAILGVALYLRQSPLPREWDDGSSEFAAHDANSSSDMRADNYDHAHDDHHSDRDHDHT
jgi:ABC-type branched-subunit amino acid transport system permease subunit